MSSADTKAHKTGPARLLTDEDVSALEAFDEGYEAYFGKMIDYLDKFVERGVKEGRFTEQQAAEDLELSLWYGFAYNNLDIYPAYYRSLEIMKPAEKKCQRLRRVVLPLFYCAYLLRQTCRSYGIRRKSSNGRTNISVGLVTGSKAALSLRLYGRRITGH